MLLGKLLNNLTKPIGLLELRKKTKKFVGFLLHVAIQFLD